MTSENYNPNVKLRFSLVDYLGKNLSDRFVIYDYRNSKFIERGKIIEKRINDIHIDVLYKCKNQSQMSCEVDDEDISLLYNLKIEYQGYYINPYNKTPILRLSNDSFVSIVFYFNPDIKLRTLFKWNIIRFEDSKWLLKLMFDKIKDIFFNTKKEDDMIKEKDIYIGGNLKADDTMIISKTSYYVPKKNSRLMFVFESNDNNNIFLYEDYIRKENYLLDVLADIFALLISFYNILSFLFYYLFSQSYDKYKIMENILSIRKNNSFQEKRKIILLDNNKDSQNGEILSEKNSEKENQNQDFMYSINDNENRDKIDVNDFIKKEEKDEGRILTESDFIDFFCNPFYKRGICSHKHQEILCECNSVILKYFSIENILYNQILLENLFEDYKWNNPYLKNILNNNSLNYFKNIIEK